jgi:hypothetical protein
MAWIIMAQDRVQFRDLSNGHEPSGFIKGRESPDRLNDNQLLKKDFASRN